MRALLAHTEDAEIAPHAEGETAIAQPPPPTRPEQTSGIDFFLLPLALGLAAAIITYLIVNRGKAKKPDKDE